jgi:hypothetical protein
MALLHQEFLTALSNASLHVVFTSPLVYMITQVNSGLALCTWESLNCENLGRIKENSLVGGFY